MKILVIGAGSMGSGIAQVFAVCGHDVYLSDIKQEYLDKGVSTIKKNLTKMVEKGKMTAVDADAALTRLHTTLDLGMAATCDLALEAIIEEMTAKKELFAKLDGICPPEVLFATNSSSLSITEIAASLAHKQNFIGMHFFNPAPVMKLVEVIRGIATSDATTKKIFEIVASVDKQAVEVKEGPGFVVNRILIPMINEAVGVLADGVASAEDIDKAMQLGANHPLGPLALADLIGNDVNLAIMETLYSETGDPKYRPHPLLRKMVRAGYLGRKTGQGFFKY